MATLAFVMLGAACSRSAPTPAALDTAHDACHTCKMIISDPRMGSQIVAPYEDPRFFDDLNCLGKFLSGAPGLPAGAMIYVADHRTHAWVRWDQAVYTRVDSLTGPMGSHVMAHASTASREADPDAARGTPVEPRDAFPPGTRIGGVE